MRAWLRRFRVFLFVLPLALVAGFGYETYQLWDDTPKAVEVAKGDTAELGPATFRLVSLTKKKPAEDSVSSVPKGAVVVVAKFRARIEDRQLAKKQKFTYCDSKIQNGDGWEWDQEILSSPYVPQDASTSCDGKRLDSEFNDVYPGDGEWYHFYTGYYVPKDLAHDLRPTLSYSKKLPDYLLFEV